MSTNVSELVFFLTENQVMSNSKPDANGEYLRIFDYEPESMAALVTNGNVKIGQLQMYRKACEDHAHLNDGLDDVRQQRYERVVEALELLSTSQEVA